MRYALGLLLLGLMFSPLTSAREIAGVDMPETVQQSSGATPLLLNGAGIRRKLFFKIYVAGLYLPSRQTSTRAVLDLPGPKRVRMHFLYKEVEKDKLVTGWQEGFENNLDSASLAQLAPRLAKFNQLFRSMRRDDVIDLDYQPNEGTRVIVNGELQGNIDGADFYNALLQVWLGEQPADADLKTALLKGTAED